MIYYLLCFREEDSLVDVFTYEIIFIFVESLAIAHQDDKSLGKISSNYPLEETNCVFFVLLDFERLSVNVTIISSDYEAKY